MNHSKTKYSKNWYFFLLFTNNAILSFSFFFFLILVDLIVILIHAVITEFRIVIEESAIPTAIPTKEARVQIEIHPVTMEAEISK